MSGRWHILLFATSAACGGLAGYCELHANGLSRQADLEQVRSASSSSSFVDTFSGEFVSSELGQMDHRRSLLQAASSWREGMLFSLVGVVFLAFAGYTVRSIETAFDDGSHSVPLPEPVLQRP